MLSVITITFNNYIELKKTLESLNAVKRESVVVNGGGCTETKNFLRSFDGICISEKDKGISDAFNKGFNLSSGHYLTYLNSGDVLVDNFYYQEAQEFLDSHPDYDFTYADICFRDQFAGEIHVKSNSKLPAMPYLHPTLVVRRCTMERIGLFNLKYKTAMDLDFAYRLIKIGAKGKYFPRMVVKMDGAGVSSKRHGMVYWEVLKIALANKDYTFRALSFFINNGLKLVGKTFLLKVGGDEILSAYRKARYRIKK